jgi:glucose 1-dehydrogenase
MFDLAGRRALVTGSARGIGRAIAQALAAHGAQVVVHGSRPREGVDAAVDLSAPDAADRLHAMTGNVDILVLNASVQIKRPWAGITAEEFDLQMHTNCLASFLLMQRYVPAMQAKGWGRILTVGSVQEAKPHPEMVAYAASKAAQRMLALSLAPQLAPYGITVNNLAPGVIDTDRNAAALADPAYLEKLIHTIPAGFVGQPQDCAGLALLLCSEAGRYITGQSIYVDGGKCL